MFYELIICVDLFNLEGFRSLSLKQFQLSMAISIEDKQIQLIRPTHPYETSDKSARIQADLNRLNRSLIRFLSLTQQNN